jgi:hypothetical protein
VNFLVTVGGFVDRGFVDRPELTLHKSRFAATGSVPSTPADMWHS